MPVKKLPAITNNETVSIITEVPADVHKALSLMAVELDVWKADLYAMLLIYCIKYSHTSVEEMITRVQETKQ